MPAIAVKTSIGARASTPSPTAVTPVIRTPARLIAVRIQMKASTTAQRPIDDMFGHQNLR